MGEPAWTTVERAGAEAALRGSEERQRLMIESIKDYAIFTIDPVGLITSWNEGARRLKGYSAEEVIGRPLAMFYLPEDAGKPEREMQLALTAGRSEDESWRVRKDGSLLWVNEIMTPLRGADSRHLGFSKISRDLTERKAFEDALRGAHSELEQRVLERTSDLQRANTKLQQEILERRAAEAQIKSLFERMVSIQEEERRRIAREIHDHLGQQLTALRMNIEVAHTRLDSDPVKLAQALRTAQLAEELDRSIDFLTWELRPAALDHLGLSAALQNLVTGWSERFSIAAEFDSAGMSGVRMAPDVESNLYRVAQEALHNILKHAEAAHVTVLLQRRDDELVLVIEDDGHGFALTPAPEHVQPGSGGLGLLSMRERAVIMGGTLEIETAPGRGTSIFVRVPAAPIAVS
jgi:PAS domain S-box-containing protein